MSYQFTHHYRISGGRISMVREGGAAAKFPDFNKQREWGSTPKKCQISEIKQAGKARRNRGQAMPPVFSEKRRFLSFSAHLPLFLVSPPLPFWASRVLEAGLLLFNKILIVSSQGQGTSFLITVLYIAFCLSVPKTMFPAVYLKYLYPIFLKTRAVKTEEGMRIMSHQPLPWKISIWE